MSSDFQASNYLNQSNFGAVAPPPAQRESAPGKLILPAMALICVAGLGLLLSGFNFFYSFGEANVDPNADPMVQEFQRGAVGPAATGIQGAFLLVNLFIIVCGVQMMKLQNWGLGVAGSVLAILNIGSCCCVLGLPVGLWSLAVLMSPDIISMYTANLPGQQTG
jgi:hypothetical protein